MKKRHFINAERERSEMHFRWSRHPAPSAFFMLMAGNSERLSQCAAHMRHAAEHKLRRAHLFALCAESSVRKWLQVGKKKLRKDCCEVPLDSSFIASSLSNLHSLWSHSAVHSRRSVEGNWHSQHIRELHLRNEKVWMKIYANAKFSHQHLAACIWKTYIFSVS